MISGLSFSTSPTNPPPPLDVSDTDEDLGSTRGKKSPSHFHGKSAEGKRYIKNPLVVPVTEDIKTPLVAPVTEEYSKSTTSNEVKGGEASALYTISQYYKDRRAVAGKIR
jgi:hypothetical protein